jgi:hypothetical protein
MFVEVESGEPFIRYCFEREADAEAFHTLFGSAADKAVFKKAVWKNIKRSFVPVLLDVRSTQAGQAVLIERMLPGEEFVDREHVTATGFVEGQEATANGRDYLGLAPDDPPFRGRRR